MIRTKLNKFIYWLQVKLIQYKELLLSDDKKDQKKFWVIHLIIVSTFSFLLLKILELSIIKNNYIIQSIFILSLMVSTITVLFSIVILLKIYLDRTKN